MPDIICYICTNMGAMYSVPMKIRVSQSKNDRRNATNAKGTGDKNRPESELPADKGHVGWRDREPLYANADHHSGIMVS